MTDQRTCSASVTSGSCSPARASRGSATPSTRSRCPWRSCSAAAARPSSAPSRRAPWSPGCCARSSAGCGPTASTPHRDHGRRRRRRAAASVAGMALAFALGDPPLVLLAALAAVTSGAGAFFFPAFVSLRPLVVPGRGASERQRRDQLPPVRGPGGGPAPGRPRRRPVRAGHRVRRQRADVRLVGRLRRPSSAPAPTAAPNGSGMRRDRRGPGRDPQSGLAVDGPRCRRRCSTSHGRASSSSSR